MLRPFLLRLGLLLLLYFVSRLLFLVFNYSSLSLNGFGEVARCFFFGLRFDIYAIAITNSLFIILHFIPVKAFYTKSWQVVLKILFYAVNIPCILFNFIDLVYYRFTLKRTTADFFQFITIGDDFKNVVPRIVSDFWYVLLLLVLLFLAVEYLYRQSSAGNREAAQPIRNLKSAIRNYTLLAAVLLLLIIAGRGGLQYKPISILTAAQYTSTQNVALVLNTPFTILKSIGKENLTEKKYYTDEEFKKLYNPIHDYTSAQKFNPLNVVVIIMESFSKEYIGYFNEGKGYTPFLDSLIRHSLVCTNAYANGKRSIEGIPAIVSGMQALSSNPYITSAYNANLINSLPLLLKEKGYASAFYHGGNNGTMGLDNFSRMAGFQKYIGKNEYPGTEDYDGTWGVYDEPFFKFYCDEMSKTKQPFVTAFFSLSSHHPYSLPLKYKNTFAEGSHPIHKTISYADLSLKTFFDCAKTQAWYSQTLFVITADHTGPSANPLYENKKGVYAIPVVYFTPGNSLTGIYTNVTQQCDIAPSVLNYLNYDKPFKFHGESIFEKTKAHYALSFSDDVYQIITDSCLLQFDGEKTIGYFDYKNDDRLTNNLAGQGKFQLPTETNVKAIIQDYNNSMIYNRLTEVK